MDLDASGDASGDVSRYRDLRFRIGLVTNTAVGPLIDVAAYSFAPQSLVAPFGGLVAKHLAKHLAKPFPGLCRSVLICVSICVLPCQWTWCTAIGFDSFRYSTISQVHRVFCRLIAFERTWHMKHWGLDVVWNALLAPFILKEKLTRRGTWPLPQTISNSPWNFWNGLEATHCNCDTLRQLRHHPRTFG